jgi:hypothetical protein
MATRVNLWATYFGRRAGLLTTSSLRIAVVWKDAFANVQH